MIPSAYRPKTSSLPTNSTLICGLSFCAGSGARISLFIVCIDNGRLRDEAQVRCMWCYSPLRGNREGVFRVQLSQYVRKTVKANTMADLRLRTPLGTLPADRLLAPGTHNRERGLVASGPPRLAEGRLGLRGVRL